MTIWEKAVIGLQRGTERLVGFAALFAERARAEVEIVRLRMNIDTVQRQMDGLHRSIGKRIADLKSSGELPRSVSALLKDETISAALEEAGKQNDELESLRGQLGEQQEVLIPAEERGEEDAA